VPFPRHRLALPALLLVAGAAALTGCGPGTAPSSTLPPAPGQGESAAPAPDRGGPDATVGPGPGSAPSATAPVAAGTPATPGTPAASSAQRRSSAPSPPGASGGRSPAALRYAFPVQGCRASYGRSHHDYPASDLFAAGGCRFVAATAGTVDEVSSTDRWSSSTNRGAERGGLSVSLVGADGVRYYGSHLSALAPGIRPGARVAAGQLLGRVGNSGDARGIATHVHFGVSWPTRAGVWWVRRGEVYPWPYLDSWRAGGRRSPAAAVAAVHRRDGDAPPCHVDC